MDDLKSRAKLIFMEEIGSQGFDLSKSPLELKPEKTLDIILDGHTLGQLILKNKYGGLSLTFDDVAMIPQNALDTRWDANLTTNIAGLELYTPIISSNMKCVTGKNMAITMAKLGGLGVIHQFYAEDDSARLQAEEVRNVKHTPVMYANGSNLKPSLDSSNNYLVGAAIGVNDSIEKARLLVDSGIDILVVDTAHGYSKKMLTKIEDIKKLYPDLPLMAGNIVTAEAALALIDAGVTALKDNIGPGVSCITRLITGHGIGTLTANYNVMTVARKYGVSVVSDGGIRYPGDIVKALTIADGVMLGGLLGATDDSNDFENRVNRKDASGIPTSIKFYGSASREAKKMQGRSKYDTQEGRTINLEYLGSTEDLIFQLIGGTRSGFSYSGAHNINELRNNARFCLNTTATLHEASKGDSKVYHVEHKS